MVQARTQKEPTSPLQPTLPNPFEKYGDWDRIFRSESLVL